MRLTNLFKFETFLQYTHYGRYSKTTCKLAGIDDGTLKTIKSNYVFDETFFAQNVVLFTHAIIDIIGIYVYIYSFKCISTHASLKEDFKMS